MYKRCFSIRSRSQTRPEICSQKRPGISLCSLFGLSLQGRGQFLVLLNQSKQDQESLSTLALDCLCQTGLIPWSVSLPFHRTNLLFLLLWKIMFPGPVGAIQAGPALTPRAPWPQWRWAATTPLHRTPCLGGDEQVQLLSPAPLGVGGGARLQLLLSARLGLGGSARPSSSSLLSLASVAGGSSSSPMELLCTWPAPPRVSPPAPSHTQCP